MAKRLKLETIAEGVETESQASFLGDRGCDELQGFYFSHPLPASEITGLLTEGGSPPRGETQVQSTV